MRRGYLGFSKMLVRIVLDIMAGFSAIVAEFTFTLTLMFFGGYYRMRDICRFDTSSVDRFWGIGHGLRSSGSFPFFLLHGEGSLVDLNGLCHVFREGCRFTRDCKSMFQGKR